MRERQSEIEKAGAKIAAIGLGDERYAQAFRAETQITFPLLVDAKREAYAAVELKSASLLHLLRKDNAAARARAKAAGHTQKALGKNPFQLGGSFVFAPDNRVLFAHVSQTFGDNAPVDALVGALRSM